jgi:hypothetical protein
VCITNRCILAPAPVTGLRCGVRRRPFAGPCLPYARIRSRPDGSGTTAVVCSRRVPSFGAVKDCAVLQTPPPSQTSKPRVPMKRRPPPPLRAPMQPPRSLALQLPNDSQAEPPSGTALHQRTVARHTRPPITLDTRLRAESTCAQTHKPQTRVTCRLPGGDGRSTFQPLELGPPLRQGESHPASGSSGCKASTLQNVGAAAGTSYPLVTLGAGSLVPPGRACPRS